MLLQQLVFKNIVTYIRGSRRKNPSLCFSWMSFGIACDAILFVVSGQFA